jgi:hypothetical protein
LKKIKIMRSRETNPLVYSERAPEINHLDDSRNKPITKEEKSLSPV